MKKLVLICLVWPCALWAQSDLKPEHKVLQARRTTQKVVIDGKLDEMAWQDAAVADDFSEFRPVIGRKWPESIRTITFLMYDDTGIYFGGHCFESTPDSIARELAGPHGMVSVPMTISESCWIPTRTSLMDSSIS